jgi:prepilin-type N-terminal cleavage/methylation domain-containing protein
MLLKCVNRSQKGFTLIEVTVSLMILVVVMVLSTTLLFSMQGFAKRQRQFAEPRQTARRGIDYIASYLRAATDGNFAANNPNAIVVWYLSGSSNLVQATYNNVVDPNLAEPGTDIITFGRSVGGGRIQIAQWNGPGSGSTASNADIHFRDGCPNNNTNMALFEQATQCQGACNGNYPCPGCSSGILTVVDSSGNWAYMQITGYQKSDCGNQGAEIQINVNPGQSAVNPPSNRGVKCPTPNDCRLGRGMTYCSLRVRRDPNNPEILQLQQKNSLFDPAKDNPGTDFFPLLDNIEDLQIAYIYNDGTIWNDSAAHLLPTTNNVPTQADLEVGNVPPPRDITNVVGIRVSVTAVANTPVSFMERAKFFRPQSEDRPASNNVDRFFHYRLTNTVMLRNRNLGG